MTIDDRTTPPPPDAAAHASRALARIRAAINTIHELYEDDDGNVSASLGPELVEIEYHAAALDAARIAAEQRAEAWDAEAHILVDKLGDATVKLAASEARIERLRALVNICKHEAQRRIRVPYLTIDWEGAHEAAGIQPGDLDPAARRDRDARGGEA